MTDRAPEVDSVTAGSASESDEQAAVNTMAPAASAAANERVTLDKRVFLSKMKQGSGRGDAFVDGRDDVTCRGKCTVLPGDGVGQVITGEVDVLDGFE